MDTVKKALILGCIVAIFYSCATKGEQSAGDKVGVVEVSATYDNENNQHRFQMDTDTIPSGWTTFRFNNASPMVHFMVIEHMPGNRTSEDSKKEVFPPFQEAMDLINAGKTQDGFAKLGELPDWYAKVVFTGGPGFTSPGKSTENTVYLEPGNYVIECYVKNEDGIFHSALGMIEDLKVTEDSSGIAEPADPSIKINLSNKGFDVEGEPTPGKHLVAVNFNEDEPPLLGNDVHVVRLGDVSVDSVAAWVDWSQPKGLVSSAENPAPAEFLGGTNEMPKGNTAYFTVELTSGDYAWISERPANNSMYKRFTVKAEKVTSNE